MINLYSSSGNNSLFRRILPEGHSLKCEGTETVSVAVLDEIIEQQSLLPPDVLKVDVEGAELHVMLGAAQTLTTHRPFIFLEYGEETCRDAGYPKEQIRLLIETYGYEVAGLSSDAQDLRLYRNADLERVSIANLLCIPCGATM